MTSKPPSEAFVWIWLPGQTAPVVAGRLQRRGEQYVFNYGRSYLEREDKIAIYDPELPLRAGELPLPGNLNIPSALRDAAPDAWGRRVIVNRTLGARGKDIDVSHLDELTYFLQSGSDRIGALDFQMSASSYVARDARNATLEELLSAADKVEGGILLHPELDQALFHGSSIGGARPKALIEEHKKKFIAKFPASNDVYSVVKAEYIAMRLAARAGIDAAAVRLVRASNKDVLLVERFDRTAEGNGWTRASMVSALTLFELDEMMARYASYETLAEICRHRFTDPTATVHALFDRLVFNILVGNTDDHARNHAAFWSGASLALTPAYDICPQPRSGSEANQAMLIRGDDRRSQLILCLEAAPAFLLTKTAATQRIEKLVATVHTTWRRVCDEAALSQVDRKLMWRRQFLNAYAFEGSPLTLKKAAGL